MCSEEMDVFCALRVSDVKEELVCPGAALFL